ncbi:type IV pilin protein [Candidatus Avelusimicrobium caledoniensis]|uniref:type IV pilin protein n=1 Tax=Candidatus Avelusimicrobium caledoniensis TaxID=3416220 RepID=UPI003D133624
MKNKQAFTLIELLVVVLIVGILAAVALPQYQRAVTKSRLSTLKHLVASTNQAAEAYYMSTGDYPRTFDEMDIDFPTPISTNLEPQDNSWGAGSGYFRAQYTWGNCALFWSPNHTNNFTECTHTGAGIGYAKRFVNSNTARGLRTCSARNETALQVCLQETGKTRNACNHYTYTTPESWTCDYLK